MDAYEATRIVLSRIQSLDPENAAKIMGLLLLQDHGEKEMIRLAFGPESLLHSVVLKAYKELGLLPPSSPTPHVLGRQNSSSRLLGVGSPRSWVSSPVLSNRNTNNLVVDSSSAAVDDSLEELVSPSNHYRVGAGNSEGLDDFQVQEQLSFLNEGAGGAGNPRRNLPVGPRSNLFDPEMAGQCQSPTGYSLGWGAGHRKTCSAAAADLFLGSDPAGLGWKPCLYFARGFCKNGSTCRFLHGPSDETAATVNGVEEQQCQEVLLGSRSPRQLMASAFPFSPSGSMPASPSGSRNCMNFLLQQQNENQRAAMAVATAAMMLGGDEAHKFIGRTRMMERSDFVAGLVNPGARQIYLTFPADSTFSEEDVSSYFSIYGPVQDVRIPYQQKRMFGFVTFLYSETVKLILAKGNPHFVCDARVLVKPYKEKGKVPEKFRKQHSENGDFSACSTPTGLDTRDAFELQQLGSRMLYNSSINQEMLLKKKLEEHQQAAELRHAIELQQRRFMGLQLLDLKNRSQFGSITSPTISSPTIAIATESDNDNSKDKNLDSTATPAAVTEPQLRFSQQCAVNATGADDKQESTNSNPSSKEEISFHESTEEHNLPDNPFASPTKSSCLLGGSRSLSILLPADENLAAPTASPCTNNASNYDDMPSFSSCFFQMPRFPSEHSDASNVNDGVSNKQLRSNVQGAVSLQ